MELFEGDMGDALGEELVEGGASQLLEVNVL